MSGSGEKDQIPEQKMLLALSLLRESERFGSSGQELGMKSKHVLFIITSQKVRGLVQ